MKKWAEMGERLRDRLVAEKVMGYHVRADGCYDGGFAHVTSDLQPAYYLFDEQGKTDWRSGRITPEAAWGTCRQYTTSMDAAWLVVEKLADQELFVNFEMHYLKKDRRYDFDRIRANFCFRNTVNTDRYPYRHCDAEPASLVAMPAAICLAALKVVGYEIEG